MAQTKVQTTRADTAMAVQTEPGATADLLTGRRRLLALLRAHRQKRLAATATATATAAETATSNASPAEGYADLIDAYNTTIIQTAAAGAAGSGQRARTAGFRPGDDNAGLGVLTAAEKAAEEKAALTKDAAAVAAAAATSTKEQRARRLMVAPGSAAHGKLVGGGRKSNGWHSSRKDEAGSNGGGGRAVQRPGRGYDSSSDEDVGRSAVGRKKKTWT